MAATLTLGIPTIFTKIILVPLLTQSGSYVIKVSRVKMSSILARIQMVAILIILFQFTLQLSVKIIMVTIAQKVFVHFDGCPIRNACLHVTIEGTWPH